MQGNTPKSEHFWSYEKSLVDRAGQKSMNFRRSYSITLFTWRPFSLRRFCMLGDLGCACTRLTCAVWMTNGQTPSLRRWPSSQKAKRQGAFEEDRALNLLGGIVSLLATLWVSGQGNTRTSCTAQDIYIYINIVSYVWKIQTNIICVHISYRKWKAAI